jgi:deoxyxylulose-5-phosphate synthase
VAGERKNQKEVPGTQEAVDRLVMRVALQEWGAMILINLLDVNKTEVVTHHGQFGLVVLHTCAIKAALSTRHALTK